MLAMAAQNDVATGRSRRRQRLRWSLPLCACLASGSGACSSEPPPPKREAKLPHETAESIPDVPVTGTIGKVPFTVQDARYYVDRRQGYEKVSVLLVGAPATSVPAASPSSGARSVPPGGTAAASPPCGPIASDAPTIWLRRKGAGPVVPGETRVAPDAPSDWAVHYQVMGPHGWTGSGDAAALLVIKQGSALFIEGELAACFADAAGSCASGAFKAQYCQLSIDMPVRGTETLERMPTDAGAPPQDGPKP